MKLKTITLALMGIALAATPAFAKDNKKCCDKKEKDCKEKQCDKEAKCDKSCPNPFEGLNLTADQQTKLDALRQDIRKDKTQACQKAKQATGEARKEMKKDGKKISEKKKEYLAKVKEILTPDQYVTFLENQYTNVRSDKGHKRHHGDKAMKMRNGDRQVKAPRTPQADVEKK